MQNKIIILGLGNPGKEYENTYHNIGKIVLGHIFQELQKGKDFSPWKKDARGKFEYSKNSSGNLILARSETFMNESGLAAASLIKKFSAEPENLLVLHDDTDLQTGTTKLVFGKGSAGHNGIKSIISSIKTNKFWRIRIGARSSQKGKALKIVLKKISLADKKMIEDLSQKIILGLAELLHNKPDKATTIINS